MNSENFDEPRSEVLDNVSNEHKDILVNMSDAIINATVLHPVSSPDWPALHQNCST